MDRTHDEYVAFVKRNADEQGLSKGLLYSTVACAAEAGEMLNITEKMLRKRPDYSEEDVAKVWDEAGDVLHQLIRVIHDVSDSWGTYVDIEDLMQYNMEKLRHRGAK